MILSSRRDSTEMNRTDIQKLPPESREKYKKIICEELWLRYFNDTLRRQRVITEHEHRMMLLKIMERTASLMKGVQKCEKQHRLTS